MRVTTITIKRPAGHTEVVDATDKFPGGLSQPMFEQVKKATKAAGKGDCLSFETKHVDTRTEAQRFYGDTVERAFSKLYNAKSANYYSPVNILNAEKELQEAIEKWEATYPAEAAALTAENEAKEAAKKESIKNSAGYQAAIEGRD